MTSVRVTEAIALVGVLLIVWSIYRAQIDPKFTAFNVFDLLMENGRVSKIACVFLGSFLATTWIMVRLTLDGKMSEGYLATYGGLWIVPIVAKIFGPTSPPAPESPK